jgi:hypothetical protein
MMSKTFLNQVQLSRRWHLSPRTLERWRWEGIGPHYLKIGGRVVYGLTDVEEYEQACVRKTVPYEANGRHCQTCYANPFAMGNPA